MGDEDKKSKVTKLRERAHDGVQKAFRAYQEWQLAVSREKAVALDPGDEESFIEWIKDEYGAK